MNTRLRRLFPAVIGGGGGAAPIVYLENFPFNLDASAPLTSYTEGTGTLTLSEVSATKRFNVASGALNGIPATANNNNVAYGAAYARAAGLCFMLENNRAAVNTEVHFDFSNTAPALAQLNEFWLTGGTSFFPGSAEGLFLSIPITISAATDYIYTLILRATGCLHIIKGGIYTTWTHVWPGVNGTTTPLYPMYSKFNVSGESLVKSWKVRQLPTPFDNDWGTATTHTTSPVSGTTYAGSADGFVDLRVTSPNPLADTAEIRYRVQDDDNYWKAYFAADGSVNIDSVSAGVATNRLTVAGAISAAQTHTIRVLYRGTKHDLYTRTTGLWTKRGTQVDVSFLDAMTDVKPVLTGSWSMSLLDQWPSALPAAAQTVLDAT